MELYKIVFAEFERFKGEERYVSQSFGTTNRIYKTKEGCLEGMRMEHEYNYLKETYEEVECYFYKKSEFKIRCYTKNRRKEVVHHYKMVEFSI